MIERRSGRAALPIGAAGVLLALGLIVSASVGTLPGVGVGAVMDAIFHYDASMSHLVVHTIRLPRAVIGALVGAALAVAGLVMQGITRNPLSSPAIFGVNAGASLMVVASTALFPGMTGLPIVAGAFLGAALGGALVFLMGGMASGAAGPVRLILAGVAVTALLSSLTQGIILFNEESTETVLYWLAGAIDGTGWSDVRVVAPWALAGIVAAQLLARSLNAMALGDDVATGLGQRTGVTRLVGGVAVVALAGASVAVAGPVGFVGLIVPHIARALVGVDHLRLVPVCALLGAVLLVYADTAARLISYPLETPVGVVTALLGTPFFLYLARRQKEASH